MKKVIAWLLVLSLTAAISIGATLAYLTDTDEDVNVMTLGKVKIDQLEYERVDDESKDADATVQEFHDNKPLLPAVTDKDFTYIPGDTKVDWAQIGKDGYTSKIWDPAKINNEVDKMVFIKNKGDYDAFVRSVFAFEAGNYTTLDQFKSMVHLNLNESDYTWEWVQSPVAIPNEEGGTTNYFIATATYNNVLAPGALTEISLSQIALDKTATNEDVEAFGETYQILVKTQGIQADGFADAEEALNEGFGVITTTNVPWVTDAATKGVDIRSALHYLEGDTTTSAITANVRSITFGLNEKYASIADSYDATLVDVEQDVPVYVYYVPSSVTRAATTYDVYFLANDDIYLPKDSSTLMMDMAELTTVNTENLNTSRTENMKQMFRKCSKLTTLDTTGWDTSKVTDMRQLFYMTGALKTIPGIANWDTGAVTAMTGMFRQAGITGDLNLSGWDVSKVTTMTQMFYKATGSFNLIAEGWNAGACTDMSYFMTQATNVGAVHAAGWNVSNVTTMYGMFYECQKMKTLDVTGWDTSNVTNAQFMFIRCRALVDFIGSGGLNFGKVVDMGSMCEGWDSMTYLDATNWNCGSATNMGQMFGWALKLKTIKGIENWDVSKNENFTTMFRYCYELENLDLSTWKPSSGKTFNSMFSDCGKLNLDKDALDNWDMSSAVKINHMFYGCKSQVELNLSGWNMPNLITTTHMFADCFSLKTVDFSDWNTPSLISLDCIFNDCTSLEYLDMGDVDTQNVTEFSQMFERCTSLRRVDGLENWSTAKSGTFVEMFLDCHSLEELNWSSFDTTSAYNNYYDTNNSYSKAFNPIFSGVNNLTKLIVSDKISYYGNGTVPEADKLVFPNPKAKEGFTAMWRNVETGELFLGKDIPEKTAAVYEAYYQYISKGATMKDALHYLNADSTGTKITAKVSNVIVGKTSEYAEIVNTYTGVLADQEQDGPVYAYYVPNGSNNYDVYILSENDIYAPANCYELFYNGEAMASLKSVDLSNLNTSRTTNMARMFRNCTALTSLDISGLDTGAVTDMSYMIYNCSALKTVNATGLNTGNVTTMANMFRNCSALTDVVGAKGWNVSKVTDMNSMFRKCTALTTVDLAGWNAASLTTMPYIFRDCSKLVSADLSGWNVSNVTNMESLFDTCGALTTVITTGWDTSKVENLSYAFYDCGNLTTLDVSGWNTGSMKNLDQTFYSCKKLATLDVSGWDTQNVDFLYATFYNCSSLTSLDVSNWDTGKVTNMNCLFAKCSSLAELDVSGWNVGNVAVFSQTFAFCPSLTALDVSNWDTSSAIAMDLMFYTDYNLEYLDVSNWDVSKVTKFNHIFATDHQNEGDMKLKNVDVSKWTPVSAVNMGSMFYGCGQLESVDMSGWNMPKLENLTHAFADCHSLKEVKLTGWNTPALISMDAMFNHCTSMKSIDVSDLDTATVREFSQMFEACTSLEQIIGMNKWNTTGGRTFTEMFNLTKSLKVLDLSAFNTGSAYDGYKTYVGDSYPAFSIMLTNMTSLEKLIIGENVSFRGNGTIPVANQMKLPAPAAKAGFTAKWRNVETGELFDASQIPEKVAATYEAYYVANT